VFVPGENNFPTKFKAFLPIHSGGYTPYFFGEASMNNWAIAAKFLGQECAEFFEAVCRHHRTGVVVFRMWPKHLLISESRLGGVLCDPNESIIITTDCCGNARDVDATTPKVAYCGRLIIGIIQD